MSDTPAGATESDHFLVRLQKKIIPPLDGGRLIGPGTLVVSQKFVMDYIDTAEAVFNNRTIAFNLRRPGGAGGDIVSNTDNWGITKTAFDVNRFWDAGVKGAGVRIGVADSGMDASLKTFQKLVLEGRLKSFASFNANGSKEIQRDASGVLISDEKAKPTFSHYHGTFCTSIIAGENDGKLRGVAPGVDLHIARVLQTGNVGTVASIDAGLRWLCDQKVDFVNLSLGWPGLHEEWAESVDALLSTGAVVVAAIGNEWGVPGEYPSRSPGNYPPVSSDPRLIRVGAFDRNGNIWDYSGGGTVDWSNVTIPSLKGAEQPSRFAQTSPFAVPDLIAPGAEIVQPIPGGDYLSDSGTSMAAPHITGLLALILSALRRKDPAARPLKAAEILLNCLAVNPTLPLDRAGKGKPDIARLITALNLD
ncbi:S8 family peptidase [Rhizobium redzepovicii]|uniref:S8 family peptidase n=1 Tax=Rhizobium redzepovicii TaxID=2867518 RepID=UPI001C934C47|nr:S8 family serine peptidase [Rhizobium redzepovicii]MBY4616149.1 S8 family serine peptidase [Rhizobium redzepovicii]